MPRSAGTLSRAVVLGAAVVVAAVLCLPCVLMPSLRHFYQARFPEVAASWALDGRFSAIPPFDDTDSNEYAGRVHEAARKAWPLDPYIKENKSRRLATTDMLTYIFMGAMERLTGDVGSGWVLSRFVGCLLWVLCLYLLVEELSGNSRWALAVAVSLTLFYELLIIAVLSEGLLARIKEVSLHAYYFFGNYTYNFGASRLANPALTFPPLFLASWLAIRAAKGRKSSALWGGLLGGLLAYIHADVWTTYMAAMPIFVALWSLEKRKLQVGLLGSWALSFIVGLPWIRFNVPLDPDLVARAGAIYGRTIDPWGAIWLLGALILWGFCRKDASLLFYGCLLGGVGAVTESQLLTGYIVQPVHWHYIGAVVGVIAATGWLGRRLSERRDFLWVAALAIMWSLGRQIGYSSLRFPFQALPKDMESAFDYLNAHTPPDSVVATAAPMENLFLPIYTHNKTLIGYGFMLASDLKTRDLMRRQKRALELFGIPESAVLAKIASPEFLGLAKSWNRDLWRGKVNWRDREWSMIWNYSHTLTPGDFLSQWRDSAGPDETAQVDYLWLGPFERQLMDARALAALGRPIYENTTVQLFSAANLKRAPSFAAYSSRPQ